MDAQGYSTVVEGWELFGEAVEEAGSGDLPNLLCQLKGKTMPRDNTTPTSIADGSWSWREDPYATPPSPVKKEQGSEEPVIVGGIINPNSIQTLIQSKP